MKLHRGSLWRKWDLHIHTPASVEHWKGSPRYIDLKKQSDKDELTRKVIDAINQSDVDVFCIMDYWTFDGYFEIKSFLERRPDVQCNSKIFPGIELRSEAPAKLRLNVHVVFSDEEVSNQQLNDFKSGLHLLGINRSLSNEALIEFAKKLDKGKAKKYGAREAPDQLTDDELLTLGFRTAEITRDSLQNAVNRLPKGSCFVLLAYDTHGGAEELYWKEHPPADIAWMQLADLFEVRRQDNIDLFLGRETAENKDHIDDFLTTIGGKPKLPVSGSDAHSINDYGRFPNGKITWIKADPTFEGLKQVLIDPIQRSFIGLTPPQREQVLNNKARYISSLQITRSNDYDKEIWFEGIGIEFNHGLVAIIGNKGMGKSALADIIGLLGNSQREKYFSFLHPEKFRDTVLSRNKAKHFEATLQWADDNSIPKNLNSSCSSGEPELVRYVPQNFFDHICNEIELKKGGEFAQELDKIIFSHIEEFKRRKYRTLDELINIQTKEIERSIASFKSSISDINNDLEEIEKQLSPAYKQQILNDIKQKQTDLSVLIANPPYKVPAPIEGESEKGRLLDEIRKIRDELSNKLEEIKQNQEDTEQKIIARTNLHESFEDFERRYNQWIQDSERNVTLLGLDRQELVKVAFSYIDKFESLRTELDVEKARFAAEYEGVQNRFDDLGDQETAIISGLHEAEKRYESYKSDLESWESRKENLQKEIDGLKTLLTELETKVVIRKQELEKKRLEVVANIFAQKVKLADVYKSLYKPVRDFIEKHHLIKNKYKLNFEVSIDVKPEFIYRFLKDINLSVAGSYRGRENGVEKLNQKLSEAAFETAENVKEFLNKIIVSLKQNELYDNAPVDIETQLKNVSLSDFYDFLFGIDYLEPRYALTLDGKELPKLSPGERGILLLIFYLLIDNDTCPLIIDQPEENLDNQSVFELLVPCVEEAKSRRQIFIVTHNPNLAVVCNADQVIYSYIDKANKNRVKYVSGSIENPDINTLIVDVLEGTWKAFNKREAMYQIIKR